MKIAAVEKTLTRLAQLISEGRFEELETDTLEIKPVPGDGNQWKKCHESACAFLNTRGGIIIFGVKEEGTGPARKYIFTGWNSHAEPKLKEFPQLFTDASGMALDLKDSFPAPMLIDFMGGKVAVVLIDELAADRKFAFYLGKAWRRILTGDHKITEAEVEKQEEYREEAARARELQPVPKTALADLDLDKLNDYINQLNRPVRIETIKADLAAAAPFLERKNFLINGTATTLGILVCGKHPGDHLGFRCQVHGYVDVPQEIARDKQDFVNNVLPLMESSLSYLLRNIQIGISVEHGGSSKPQYPEELLRETVNNALAHRDYSIDRQVILTIKPGEHIAIKNPGSFRRHVVIEFLEGLRPIRRILPEAKPKNPKLADILRVFRKWEGRGIGMATMVNLCLQNEIDLPYYRFGTDEVTLFLCSGQLLDDHMIRLFESFDGYIGEKLQGGSLNENQKLVLTYLIKSEWANQQVRYTILLAPDNNHFSELAQLEKHGLIFQHPSSTGMHPVYVPDPALTKSDYSEELREMFGLRFVGLDELHRQVLGVLFRHRFFSSKRYVSAKGASFNLWPVPGSVPGDIRAFDAFYRKVRRVFNYLEKEGIIQKVTGTRGYVLTVDGGNDPCRLAEGVAPQNSSR